MTTHLTDARQHDRSIRVEHDTFPMDYTITIGYVDVCGLARFEIEALIHELKRAPQAENARCEQFIGAAVLALPSEEEPGWLLIFHGEEERQVSIELSDAEGDRLLDGCVACLANN